MSLENIRQKTITGLFWAFAEKIGTQLISFVVSIVLARLLMPEEYGVISIVFVIINLCNVFVESGFGSSLVQKKEPNDVDFSSVFYCSFSISCVIYLLLFCFAPFIADFYKMDQLCSVIRVMGLRIIVGSYGSILKAKVTKSMEFRKFFFSSLGGTLSSAVVGIAMAYAGFGVWSLVAQNGVDVIMDTLVLAMVVRWKPAPVFSYSRVKELLQYSWKVQVSAFTDALYDNFRTLYIGKLYTTDDLAFYTRGKQFPNLLVENVNSSISSVLFPVISAQQDDREAMRSAVRRSMKTSAFILTPMLCGLAAVAEPMVKLVLTEKWLPCVPFLQVLCINFALSPLQTANIQAIYAMGRSDICLKINIIKKSFGLVAVIVFARISVLAMTWAGVFTGIFSLCVNMYPNKKLLNYGIADQICDILPYWLLSAAMALIVLSVKLLHLSVGIELAVMVFVGVVSYVLLSWAFKMDSFVYIWDMMKSGLTHMRHSKSK